MSVVGIDFGSHFSKVAVAHKKAIMAVPNEISKLLTPSVVGFSEKERNVGDSALSSYRSNYKNSVRQMKRFFGRRIPPSGAPSAAAADESVSSAELKQWNTDAQWLHCEIAAANEDGSVGFKVQTCDGEQVLTPEQVLAPLLRHMQRFTSTYLEGNPVKDCVLAVPTFFDDSQRRALLRAAALADLNVLRLFNETTAVALNYGIVRDLPEKETRRVIFVDVGYSNTQVAVADFQHGKLQTHVTTHDAYLGGRDFDKVIYDKFVEMFEAKNPSIKLSTRVRSQIRLLSEVEKIKKILSANREAHLHIECFVDEIDFDCQISREDFEQWSAPLTERISALVAKTVELMMTRDAEKQSASSSDAASKKVTVHSVEIVGGCSRIPCVQQSILAGLDVNAETKHIKSLNTTLNGDESVSRGCALMCAMLSPNFRVREFEVMDVNHWPVQLTYQPTSSAGDSAGIITQGVLKTGHPLPCSAKVNMKEFSSVDMRFTESSMIAPGSTEEAPLPTPDSIDYQFVTRREIARLRMNVPALKPDAVQAPKLKMVVPLSRHGILDMPNATLTEWIEETVKVPIEKPKKKKEEEEPATEDAKKTDGGDQTKMDVDSEAAAAASSDGSTDASTDAPADPDSPMKDATAESGDGTAADASADSTEKKEEEPEKVEYKLEKKKRKVTTSVEIVGQFLNEVSVAVFEQMSQMEHQMTAMDNIVRETAEMRNAVESYMFDMRYKCEDTHRDFMAADARESFLSVLQQTEDWLYDEGEEAGKTVFEEKLTELKKIGGPMMSRAWEFENRPNRINALKKLIFSYQQFAQTKSRPVEPAAAKKDAAGDGAGDAPVDASGDSPMTGDSKSAEEVPAAADSSAEQVDESSLSDEDKRYYHISRADKDTVVAAVNQTDQWLTSMCVKQDRLSKADKPALTCADIEKQYRKLMEKCQPIVTQPKPKPKAKPKKKKEAEPAPAEDASGAADAGAGAAPETGDASQKTDEAAQEVPVESPPTEDTAMEVE